MKKIIKILASIFAVILLILALIFFYISQKSHQPFLYFPKIILQSFSSSPKEKLNFVILGLDRRNDWLEKTETTDTIIFSQVNPSQGKIHLFSLPRDLWDYYTGTKINQIYPLSLVKNNNQEKFTYISENFASISGQPVDRVLLLSTENLKHLADVLGGIDIFLKDGFIDKEYPNDAYIFDPKSGAPIYKTVEFKSGWIHLDSSNITEFVRSRKSAQTAAAGGTDIGRIERQQQLINALIDKIKNTLPKNPQSIFKLYAFWQNLETNFTDQDIFDYVLKYGLKIKNLQINRHPVGTGEDPKQDLLYHPKKFINSQWVFIPHDKDYRQLQEYISQSLVSL